MASLPFQFGPLISLCQMDKSVIFCLYTVSNEVLLCCSLFDTPMLYPAIVSLFCILCFIGFSSLSELSKFWFC